MQHLYRRGVVVAQIRCWDASLLPLANRTDSAASISSGMVTCANSTTTCAVSFILINKSYSKNKTKLN